MVGLSKAIASKIKEKQGDITEDEVTPIYSIRFCYYFPHRLLKSCMHPKSTGLHIQCDNFLDDF